MDLSKSFAGFLLVTYLALATVYWLPGASPEILRAIKIGIFGLGAILIWRTGTRSDFSFITQSPFGAPIFLLLLFTAVPGFLFAIRGEALRRILDFILVFGMMWTSYIVAKNFRHTASMLSKSAIILAILAIPSVTNFVTGFPAWLPPAQYQTNSLAAAGFGAARTAWSNGLSLYIPLLLLPVLRKEGSGGMRAMLIGLVGFMVASQYVSGGRTGLLTSILTIIAMVMIPSLGGRPRWTALLGASFAAAFAIVMLNAGWVNTASAVTQLRLDRLGGSNSWLSLDAFSAGRLDLMAAAIDQFIEQPFGSGFGNAAYEVGTDFESYTAIKVHNLWLRLLVETGPFLVAALAFFALLLVRAVMRSITRLRKLAVHQRRIHFEAYEVQMAYLVILVQGLFISQFEPAALIGSFQATAIWWVVAGVALKNAVLIEEDFRALAEPEPIDHRAPAGAGIALANRS